MRIRRLLRAFWLLVPVLALAAAGGAAAQQRFPDRPVRLVVPAAPGSSPDALGRMMSTRLAETWGQPLVVENVLGAGGVIGHDRAAKSKPDGYTLLMGLFGPMSVSKSLGEKLPYDPATDFAPVTLLVSLPNLLAVHPGVPAHNLAELLAYARQNPGKLRFGFPGEGTSSHLSSELLNEMAGIRIVGVPYKSSAQMVTDLIGGHIEMPFLPVPQLLPHVRSGALRAIAVSARERSASALDIPTLHESGLPGYDIAPWFALYAPAGTPDAVVRKLNADVAAVFSQREVVSWLSAQAFTSGIGSPEALSAYQAAEEAKWRRLAAVIRARSAAK